MKKLEKNWFEWCVFVIGSVLVVSTVGYLVYEALWTLDRPAALEVRLGKAERRGGDYVVPVTVVNSGDQPAKTVHVEVRLETGDGEAERVELQIQLVPGRAQRRGFVTFRRDPTTADAMEGRAISFESM